MIERQQDDVVEALRRRLGNRHQAGLDEGRADLVQALRDELSLSADEAEVTLRRLIHEGRVRYVPAHERDVEHDATAQHDEYLDRDQRTRDDNPATTGAGLGLAVPPTGGPQQGYSGVTGTAAPVAAAGTGSAAAGPLAVAAADSDLVEGQGPGYWDIGGQATGVVPSTTRKGQVEPRGT